MIPLITIVELPGFIRDASEELGPQSLDQLKLFLAANPEAGVLVKGTGGIRKLRWAASGRGKSGGGRVIYYFHSEIMPLFLIAFFKKGEKADLTEKEKQAAKQMVETLVKQFDRVE